MALKRRERTGVTVKRMYNLKDAKILLLYFRFSTLWLLNTQFCTECQASVWEFEFHVSVRVDCTIYKEARSSKLQIVTDIGGFWHLYILRSANMRNVMGGNIINLSPWSVRKIKRNEQRYYHTMNSSRLETVMQVTCYH